jgi:D-alanine-D-alanine ligase
VPIGIDRAGRFQRVEAAALLSGSDYHAEVGRGELAPAATGGALPSAAPAAASPRGAEAKEGGAELERVSAPGVLEAPRELSSSFGVDVFFPIVHGPFGEDGCLQGLLEMAGAPYVGCGVLGSAVGMDKDVAKRLLRDAGLPVVEFVVVRRGRASADLPARVARELGFPCFVKPASLGSSVGVVKVVDAKALPAALDEAFRFDEKVLVERAVDAREIETAVLGGLDPEVAGPGEIVPRHEFYSYEAKYLDADGAELLLPAPLSDEQTAEVRSMSLRAFEALELSGLARVDFFLDRRDGRFYVNEVNTLPGFTEISMYARMWQHQGLSFRDLLTRLLELARQRFDARRALAQPR